MSDLTKGVEFSNNEQVTATKLNNLVDNATINTGAVTTDKIQDGAITRDKLAEDAMGIKSVQTFKHTFTSTSTGGQNVVTSTKTFALDGSDGNAVDASKTVINNMGDSSRLGSLGNLGTAETTITDITLTDSQLSVSVTLGAVKYYYLLLQLVEYY